MDSQILLYLSRILAKKRYTSFEIVQKLAKKGLEENSRQEYVGYLANLKLIDDRSYAEAYIHDRLMFRPCGMAVIRSELSRKGISGEIISIVISEAKEMGNDSEYNSAMKLLENKSGRFIGLDSEIAKRRKYSLLARNGFSFEIIRRILDM